MKVVTSAMITSIANSASEIAPFSSARLSTISSVSPRVFRRMASARNSSRSSRSVRAANALASTFVVTARTKTTIKIAAGAHCQGSRLRTLIERALLSRLPQLGVGT